MTLGYKLVKILVNNNDKTALAEGGTTRFALHNPITDRSRLLAAIGVRSPFVPLRDRSGRVNRSDDILDIYGHSVAH